MAVTFEPNHKDQFSFESKEASKSLEPNLGIEGFALGHPITFSAIVNAGARTYFQNKWDEAHRRSREEAVAMEKDPFVMGIVNERRLASSSLKWHLEVDNDQDPHEIFCRDAVTAAIKRTPKLQKMIFYLLGAIWYGRYASSVKWKWDHVRIQDPWQPGNYQRVKMMCVADHRPINGDKVDFNFDGTPAIAINPGEAQKLKNADFISTNTGRAILLTPEWRRFFIFHTHEMWDADFYDPLAAGMVNGVGLRHFIFWYWWLKSEWLSNIADWCARTGLGVRLWYFQAGNKQSYESVKNAAETQTDKTNILIPRSNTGQEGVEYVDTTGSGANLLLELIKHLEQVMERYMIGQTLSSSSEGNGLGGAGVASLHANTKSKIIAFDAQNLAETLTTDLVEPIKKYSLPQYRDIPLRWVFSLDDPDPEKYLSAVERFASLGGAVEEDQVLGKIGFSKPRTGAATIPPRQPQMGAPGAVPPGMPNAAPPGQPQPGMNGNRIPPELMQELLAGGISGEQ